MSRRTRIKFNSRPQERFALNHHFQYDKSATHFPRSYSVVGRPILFPKSVMPLYSKDKVCFVGDIREFQIAISQQTINFETLKMVSLSFKAEQYQESSTYTNMLVFATSILCFCFNFVPKSSKYRNSFYPKYSFKEYELMVKAVERFNEVETLVINYQDNDINQKAAEMLDQAFSRSNIKNIILRNMTYFIEVDKLKSFFTKSKAKASLNFMFIWEEFSIKSQPLKQHQEEEKLIDLSDQI